MSDSSSEQKQKQEEYLQPVIAPSLLAADFANIHNEITKMTSQGAGWMHMDVMDGHFVPDITMGPPVLKSVHKNLPNLFMDCHMMVADPARWVKPVAEAGGRSYTFHLEALKDPEEAHDVVALIKSHGMRAAVGISPSTPTSAITDKLGESVDMLLVMTVIPGAGGQKFMESCVPKIMELRKRFPGKDIQVDGGVTGGNVGTCSCAGSNIVVAGTALFRADDPKAVMDTMKDSVHKYAPTWNTPEHGLDLTPEQRPSEKA